MNMKNLIYALPMIALGSISFGASAQAISVSAVGDVQKTVTKSTEDVGYRRYGHHHYRYYGGYRYNYGYGYGYDWKRYCYNHPYNWRCTGYDH
jgi:hypothetical protein